MVGLTQCHTSPPHTQAYGVIDDVEQQWWYFSGHAMDSAGNTFSLYTQVSPVGVIWAQAVVGGV